MNSSKIEQAKYHPEKKLEINQNYYNVILLNCNFNINDIYNSSLISESSQLNIQKELKKLLNICFGALKDGGLLFVYNIPKYLIFYGDILNGLNNECSKMLFKYWIALDINDMPRKLTLKPTHLGLLMYLKTRNTKTTSPFHLNTKTIRVPYDNCRYCGKNVKDWGGKKHLMNPLGACLSDIWKDLPKLTIKDHIIPKSVKNRIYDLTKFVEKDFNFLYLTEETNLLQDYLYLEENDIIKPSKTENIKSKYFLDEKNEVLHENCIDYLKRLNEQYPEGVFDLFFADPPYNLEKEYTNYNDDLKDKEYLTWCLEWLELGVKSIRPGGALLILNLPRWGVPIGKFLLKHLSFHHWIAWDAMSTPAGKIMPAHYALLYFTKPGSPITFNYENKFKDDLLSPIDSNVYCLRESCIKERKKYGNDEKLPLTDIWWDIHRIKHKKDRDFHPCQLPIKLMERIVNMTTNKGDTVFDPLSGTGTTSIAAKILNRNYVSTEIDRKYVLISKRNLNNIKIINNRKTLERDGIKKEKIIVPKKRIEIKYVKLCQSNKKLLSQEELKNLDPFLLKDIKNYYPSFKTLQKITRRIMEMSKTLEEDNKNFKKISEFF